MKTAEADRKKCLQQQTRLRRLMMSSRQPERAIRLFLRQHAVLHSAKMAHAGPWSFEDEILDDMPEERIRRIPRGGEHSVAWLIWHIARCEDITMNLLAAGSPQVLHKGNWLKKMKITARDTGNTMGKKDMAAFSNAIDIRAMRAYRLAVGRRTRTIVRKLKPADLQRNIDPSRLQRVWDEGAVAEAARGIVEYWGRRNVAGLLLMPATRHNLIHLNEALRLKSRRR